MPPLLSICIPTYRHEGFIAQTLEGCLSQQTDFEVEIVIGDDGSSDNTPHIIAQYAKRYPHKIRAFLHPKNLGPSEPKELGGKNNVVFLFGQCKGQYIALCEGDDYWTNPRKLQTQVDFLENNPAFALTHHQTQVIYEDGSPSHFFNGEKQRGVSTVEDLLTGEWFVATASSVFRNVFQKGMPPWFMVAASGDLGIFIQAAFHGKVKYFSECMAVYRKHRGGMTQIHTSQNAFYLQNRKEMLATAKQEWESRQAAGLANRQFHNNQ